MSDELVVLAYPTRDSEKFFVTVRVLAENVDAESRSLDAAAEHPLHRALKAVGIERASLHSEMELRTALSTIGLTEKDIASKFRAARQPNTIVELLRTASGVSVA